jgi:predicted permease
MALLAIGASFSFADAKKKFKPALAASLIKLFALPLVFLPVAVAMGFRAEALVAIFVMLGSPTTVTCYIMSKNMKNDHVLSSNIVMIATLLSSVSVTFWVFVMKYLSLI